MKKYFSLLLVFVLGFVFLGCNDLISTEVTTDEIITEQDIALLSDQLEGFDSLEALREYFSDLQVDTRNDYYSEDAVLTPGATNDEATDGGGETKDHSETNVQVDGIAEMDSIITDGYYIYMARNHKLQIIDVDTMTVIYVKSLENGYYQGIFLYEDTLVAVYNEYKQNNAYMGDYMYWWGWGASSLVVDIIDVADKANVEVSRTLEFYNSYLTDMRMIEDQVYLMMNSYQWNYYRLDMYAEDALDDVQASEITSEEDLVNEFIPKYKDSAISNDYLPLSWQDIFYFPDNDLTNNYLLVGSFSVNDEAPIDLKAYLGNGFEVYMNHQNLYIAGSQYVFDEASTSYSQFTNILRFEIMDKKLVYRASNQIEGWTLNQFSFDEYDGVLRVATTIYRWDNETWESDIANQLYLLDARDEDLTLISQLEGLGKPNERIYAVRMTGDIGYVVTFVNTDPLYKIDLSDPENPQIIGELYEEGVSDYLHPYSDDLMIGIGRQAITQDGWTNFVGVKVALYDVSGDDPLALDTLLVEGQYSYSPVTYNHKLFVEYDRDETYLFAIPVYGYNDDYSSYYQAVYVYEVNDSTLTEKAILIEENEYYYWGYIEKAIFIGDSVYTISYSQITEYDMTKAFEKVDTLVLESFDEIQIKPDVDEETTDGDPVESTEYDVNPDSDMTE